MVKVMYEKLMYKVQSKNNKVLYRLQDFTLNDNVDEDEFAEGRNSNGAKRLQCQVKVLHMNEFQELERRHSAMKEHVEKLETALLEKNREIEKLKGTVSELQHAQTDKNLQMLEDKFDILVSSRSDVEKLKETHEKELLAIGEASRKDIEMLSSHYVEKVDELNRDMLQTVADNGKRNDILLAEISDLKSEIIDSEKKHHAELEKLQHVHSAELQSLEKEHLNETDKLKQTVADNNRKHLEEIAELERLHHKQVEHIRLKFLKLLSSEHARDMADLNECDNIPVYVRPFARAHIRSLNEFKKRKYMNTPELLVKSYELEDMFNNDNKKL